MKKTKTLKIHVTKACIKKGLVGDPYECPIARALIKKGAGAVAVGDEEVDFCFRSGYYHIELPKRAKAFVERYDALKSVKPFDFTLKLR